MTQKSLLHAVAAQIANGYETAEVPMYSEHLRGFLRCKTMWMHDGRTFWARPWVYRQKATLLCARQQQAVGHAATRMLLQLQRRIAQAPSGSFPPL